jgi:hypothetical protein
MSLSNAAIPIPRADQHDSVSSAPEPIAKPRK